MIDVETEYEKRVKRWKKIVFFLTILMILAFFVFMANVHSMMKKEAPYVIENCKFLVENEYVGEKPSNEMKAKKEMEKYLHSYEIRNVSFVFDPCMGWKGEAWKNGTIEKIITVCEDGKILVYKKHCEAPDLARAISNLIKVFKWE